MDAGLYIVGTPIGNLGDVSFRALETLKEADLIVAEDTRQTKKIFSVYEIPTEGKFFWSFHAKSSDKSMEKFFSALQEGKNIALVSDAGTPGISDPGTKLVGDVEFSSANEVAGAITPVPGGVGPMTIACLLHNALQQACRINGVEVPD